MLMPVLVRTPDRHTPKSNSEPQSQSIRFFKPPRSRITGTRQVPGDIFRTFFKTDLILSSDINTIMEYLMS